MADKIKLLKIREYPLEQKPDETLYQYYKRIAKSADKRLDRLEAYSKQEGFAAATDSTLWAYSKAMDDIHRWGTESSRRFFTKPPEDPERMLAKIGDIKRFLSSATSTKQGITNVYIKRANTINEKYGTNFTWEQLAQYYLSKQNERWDQKFGSKTALKVIAKIQDKFDTQEKLEEGIKAARKKISVLTDGTQIDQEVNRALRARSLKLTTLIG